MNKESDNLYSFLKFRIEFGIKLRECRRSKNLTLEDLALMCETDGSYIGKIERGEISVGLDSLNKILTALDIQLITAIFK